MKFSYFNPPITTKKPFDETSLEKVYHMVASDESLRKLTREFRFGEKKEKGDLFPFITPSFLSKGRKLSELISYTGILCIDLDDVTDMTLAERIKTDTQFQPGLLFVSPSGNGLKIFYRIDKAVQEDHLLYFKAFSHYYLQTYGKLPDQSCKDIPRPCFLCHDPNVFYSTASVDSEQLLNLCADFCKPVEKRTQYETKPEFNGIISMIKSFPVIHARALQDLKNAGWKNHSGNYWTRPGKERGTSGEYKQKGDFYKFYNYSSGAALDTAVGYDDIDLIAFFEFNGDNSKCIKALATELGFSFNKVVSCEEFQSSRFQGSNGREPWNSETLKPCNTGGDTAQKPYFRSRNIAQVMEDGEGEELKRKICGSFLYENTITYFFSRTNYGKSLLAFQMAYAAATGTNLAIADALLNDCGPLKVLVVDLEMESQDLFERHSIAMKNMDPRFIGNLHYLHEEPSDNMLFGNDLLLKIEEQIVQHHSKLVIIDNLSKLLPDSINPEKVTKVISSLRRIKQRTHASFLVIGHTTKGNSSLAIQESDYFGSSMVQNFFSEVFYLDTTLDEKFFLCQVKTKRPECYKKEVPVFTRGEHPKLGVGFNYEYMRSIEEVQLPATLGPVDKPKKRNLKGFLPEIAILDREGVNRSRIAELLDVSRGTLYRLLEKEICTS